jgi:ankyrin repeat protein
MSLVLILQVMTVRIFLRAAVTNGHLDVTRQLLSNGSSVHSKRKHDWTAQLAAAGIGRMDVFHEFLKHSACVVILIKIC